MKRFGIVRVSARRFAVLEYVGPGNVGYAGGVFEHWRMIGGLCKGLEAHKRLADAIANARYAEAEKLKVVTEEAEEAEDFKGKNY